MLSDFIEKQLNGANYKLLTDGTYFGEIPLLQGVWANKKRLEDCRNELKEILEEWIVLKLQAGDTISGISMVGAVLLKSKRNA